MPHECHNFFSHKFVALASLKVPSGSNGEAQNHALAGTLCWASSAPEANSLEKKSLCTKFNQGTFVFPATTYTVLRLTGTWHDL